MKSLLFILLALSTTTIWAHGNEDHSEPIKEVLSAHRDSLMNGKNSSFDVINKMYLKEVKPLFRRACFDCHGAATNYPWYYKLPGIKQLIDSDIKTAKSHLDFTADFPFKSHDTPLNDLNAISKSIKNKTMPPFFYGIMHNKAKLTDKEIQTIQIWVDVSKKKLISN